MEIYESFLLLAFRVSKPLKLHACALTKRFPVSSLSAAVFLIITSSTNILCSLSRLLSVYSL